MFQLFYFYYFFYSYTAVSVHTPLSCIGNFKDKILAEFYWYGMLLLINRDFHLRISQEKV